MPDLITVVGGYVTVLPFMLQHYRNIGIHSFFVHLHLASESDPTGNDVRKVTDSYGIDLSSTTVGKWHAIQQELHALSSRSRPGKWFVYADQDELHEYPCPLDELIEYCERKGYDYVTGAFVDRVSDTGNLRKVEPGVPLESQFPLGGWISYPMSGAYPLKIVLAKGEVRLDRGQHNALNGIGCPLDEVLVQVHHYKWIEGILPVLERRAAKFKELQLSHWTESARIASYLRRNHERIVTSEPQFFIDSAVPVYKRWESIKNLVVQSVRHRRLPPHLAWED